MSDIKQEAVQRLKMLKPNQPQMSTFFNYFDIMFVQDITSDVNENQRLREASSSEINIINNAKELTGGLPYFIVRKANNKYVTFYIFHVSPEEEHWNDEKAMLTRDEDGFITSMVFEMQIEVKVDDNGNQNNTTRNKYRELKINLEE